MTQGCNEHPEQQEEVMAPLAKPAGKPTNFVPVRLPPTVLKAVQPGCRDSELVKKAAFFQVVFLPRLRVRLPKQR